MLKFKRGKTLKEIRLQCKEQRLKLDTKAYRNGSDFIFVSGGGATVAYNTTNGDFGGTTPWGEPFHNNSHDARTPWYKALLYFFNTNED